MQENELKEWEELGISEEEWLKLMEKEEMLDKACEILEEHPEYVFIKNGNYVCMPDAPIEVEFYVESQNYMNELLTQKNKKE